MRDNGRHFAAGSEDIRQNRKENSAAVRILSTRGYESGCWMPVAWAAEDAFAAVSNADVFAPDLERRKYWFRNNRVARSLVTAWPSLQKRIYGPLGSSVVLFLMALDNNFMPLIQDEDRKKWIYLFDTWEPDWREIERKLSTGRNIQAVYMSSSQAAEHFQGRLPFQINWLPQAAISHEFNEVCVRLGKRRQTPS